MNHNNYPNPRIGIIFPASVLVLIGIMVLVLYLFRGMLPSRHAGGILADSGRARVHDSIEVSQALARMSLAEYGREVAQARGDSLAALLKFQAGRVRVRWRLDTLVQRDTVRDSVLVAGADVRAVLVSDSSCTVRADSLAGELVQCRYDADQCAEEIAKKPTSCNGWSAFVIGVGVGAAASAAACLVVR